MKYMAAMASNNGIKHMAIPAPNCVLTISMLCAEIQVALRTMSVRTKGPLNANGITVCITDALITCAKGNIVSCVSIIITRTVESQTCLSALDDFAGVSGQPSDVPVRGKYANL